MSALLNRGTEREQQPRGTPALTPAVGVGVEP